VFTYAVIEGLKASADLSHSHFIDAQELSTSVQGTVRKLTADKQQPTFPQSGRSDFVISKVRYASCARGKTDPPDGEGKAGDAGKHEPKRRCSLD